VRPRVWRGSHLEALPVSGHDRWRYTVPLPSGTVTGSAATWRAAYDRTCALIREELARFGIEVPAT
jgi:hypothetical protein